MLQKYCSRKLRSILAAYLSLKILLLASLIVIYAAGAGTPKMAVADLGKLQKYHPSWDAMLQLDQQIDALESGLSVPEHGKTRRALEEEWSKELQDLEARLQALHQQALPGEEESLRILKEEAKEKVSQIKGEVDLFVREKFKTAVVRLQQGFQGEMKDENKKMQEALNALGTRLAKERDREVEAKKAQLEQEMGPTFEKKRSELKREVLAYQDKILKKYQDEKLNLQLQLSLAGTPEEKKTIEGDLNRILDQETKEKEEREKELEGQYQAFRSSHLKEIEKKLRTFAQEASQKAARRLEEEKQRYVTMLNEKVREHNRKLQEELDAIKSSLTREATHEMRKRIQKEARDEEQGGGPVTRSGGKENPAVVDLLERKENLEWKIKNLDPEHQEAFLEREKLEKRLFHEEERISKEARLLNAGLSGHEKSGAARPGDSGREERLRALKAQRSRLLASIREEVRAQVESYARKKGYEVVVGEYYVNLRFPNLTEEVKKELQRP